MKLKLIKSDITTVKVDAIVIAANSDEICNILEKINSNDIYIGFRIQITNRLGFTARPSGAGGDIERTRAKHFNNLADKIKITHPTVSSVYRYIAENYISDGQRMDKESIQDSLR